MQGTTPMFKQYNAIKAEHEDAILFFRMGDFYEMFGEDAEAASRVLGLALTARDGGNNVKVPMCGVPFHSSESYVATLVSQGYKVAICEQVEDPKEAKGLVKREVIRIITPGIVLDDQMLAKDNNYIAAVASSGKKTSFAIADASTGAFFALYPTETGKALEELDRYHPVEIVYSEADTALLAQCQEVLGDHGIQYNGHYEHAFHLEDAEAYLKGHFQVNSLEVFGYANPSREGAAIAAAGGLLSYIETMQRSKAANITQFHLTQIDDYMVLDRATRYNLEIERSLAFNDGSPALLDILDETKTAFGRRLLRQWLEHPLTQRSEIENRLAATAEFFHVHQEREALRDQLEHILDMERITSRISYQTANAKDILSLKQSLMRLPAIKRVVGQLKTPSFQALARSFDTLQDLYAFLDRAIAVDAPFSLRDGGLIRDGYNDEVDDLRSMVGDGKNWLTDFLDRERERTNIKNLKVGFNKVFGYYIEITKSQLDKAPADYERKQTLANSERYITPDLKDMEAKMLGASDRLKSLEYDLFVDIRRQLGDHVARILATSRLLALLDVHAGLATCAIRNQYTRPVPIDQGIAIRGLRHPMVEQAVGASNYVANDVSFDPVSSRFVLLTGPNMSGKSTYCRSIAIASIMMQIGSFVPAEAAEIAVVDRVFARIGASDQLSKGQSTFMVEMNEVANILNYATSRSLVVLDEVGRGTSTYDGLSIAYAIVRYMNTRIQAMTIFATHYHELTSLAQDNGIVNRSVAVDDVGSDIVFRHTIKEGPASKSYGIHVAKMAGLPAEIIAMAENALQTLEKEEKANLTAVKDEDISLREQNLQLEQFISLLANWDIEGMSVGDLLNRALALKEEAGRFLQSSDQ